MKEFICALCGEAIDEMDDDYDELADGRLVCMSCYRSKCKRCIGCDELFPKEDMIETDSDEYCCRSCYDESISVCDGCRKSISHYLMNFTKGQWLCPDCYKPPETIRTMPEYTLQDLLRQYQEKRKNS